MIFASTVSVLLLSSLGPVDAAAFQQVGSTLFGPSVGSFYGQGVTLSDDGLHLAIGAPSFDSIPGGANDRAGQVSLYNFDGTGWVSGVTLIGAPDEVIGDRISLSANGDRLVLRRARSSSPDVASIIDVGTGAQVGGELSCAFNGIEVSIAPSGNRVAVSCETFNTFGRAEIFDLVGSAWTSIGTIDGDNTGSLFGCLTVFDSTGDRIAISAPNQDSNSLSNNGVVRVFDYASNQWNQVGGDLIGVDAGEQFGVALDLSSDGTTLVVGSPLNSGAGLDRGKVTAWDLVGGTTWQQMGSMIDGEVDGDRFGRSVSISADGSRLAASSYLHNQQRGHVMLYDFDGSGWVFIGEMEGTSQFDAIGLGVKSIALDGSGDRLGYGLVGGEDGNGDEVGGARVFDIVLTPSPTPAPSPASTPTPPTPSSTSSAGTGTVTPTVVLGKFDWDLDRLGNVTVSFSTDTASEELVLNYNIHLRDYDVEIFQEDCLTPVASSVVGVSSDVSITSATHGDLEVTLDVRQDSVVGSGIWTDTGVGFGLIALCIRVDLLNNDVDRTSVHFHEQRLFVTIDLTQDFHVEDIDLARIAPAEESESVTIDYDLYACHCDASYVCTDNILTQGSDIFICVFSNETNVDIVSIPTLDFKQGNTTYRVVENTLEDSLTEVTIGLNGGSLAVIRSQLISELFVNSDPANLTAWGDAVVAFVARRERGLRTLAKGSETGMAGFNIEVALASSVDGEEGESSGGTVYGITSLMVAMFAGVFGVGYDLLA